LPARQSPGAAPSSSPALESPGALTASDEGFDEFDDLLADLDKS
jgi:hypothetical protein